MPFNDSQLKAIAWGQGPCMVLAGPGSGKTTVIVHRVRHLIEVQKIPADRILVVTFTRAAAGEMRSRFLELTERQYPETLFGTFHAVFFMMLRQKLNLQPDCLFREYEKLILMEEVFRELKIESESQNEVEKTMLAEISRIKNGRIPPEKWDCSHKNLPFARIYGLYEEKARKNGRMDYDDMMVRTYELLQSDPAFLAEWQEKFRYILVDEFQDINPLQYDILKLLALPENNLFIVGDDDQSIYRFRNADPAIMLGFPRDYQQAERILLGINYRCPPTIVDHSVRLISHNKARFEKRLEAAGKNAGENPGSLETLDFPTEKEECLEAVRRLEQAHEKGMAFSQMAVLYRTNNSAPGIIAALQSVGIPFHARDRIENSFRDPVMTPVYGYLNWTLGNRSRRNFLKFMNCPVRYFKRKDLMEDQVDPERMLEMYEKDASRSYMTDKLEYLLYQLELLYKMQTPFARINFIRKGMEFDRYAENYAKEHGRDPKEVLTLLDEIQDSSRTYQTVEAWYSFIAAYTKALEDQEQDRENSRQDRVTLSTLHGSKGLQYELVVILNLNEGVIPHEKAVKREELEEERRMLYVGMTRAISTLLLCSAGERFGKKTEKSRFLKEL